MRFNEDQNRIALSTKQRDYTYREIEKIISGYSTQYRHHNTKIAPVLTLNTVSSCLSYLGALESTERVIPIGMNLFLANPERFKKLFQNHGLYAARSDWELISKRLPAIDATLLDELQEDSRPSAHLAQVVLHTSSSTNETKAVLINPNYLPSFFRWCQDSFQVSKDDRFLWVSPLHFDMSFLEIFLPLSLGATIHVPEPGELFYVERFIPLIEESRVSVIHSVPSIWHGMVTSSHKEIQSMLRKILVAGDILPLYFFRRLKELFEKAEIYNVYGQTEANSYLYKRLTTTDLVYPFNLGTLKSYANVAVDGGELVVAGENVAIGYLGPNYDSVSPFNGTFRTRDRVSLIEHEVRLLGRDGDGEVTPLKIRSLANSVPGVVQSAFRTPELFFERDLSHLSSEVSDRIQQLLPDFQVKEKGLFPLNYNGKLDLQSF